MPKADAMFLLCNHSQAIGLGCGAMSGIAIVDFEFKNVAHINLKYIYYIWLCSPVVKMPSRSHAVCRFKTLLCTSFLTT